MDGLHYHLINMKQYHILNAILIVVLIFVSVSISISLLLWTVFSSLPLQLVCAVTMFMEDSLGDVSRMASVQSQICWCF